MNPTPIDSTPLQPLAGRRALVIGGSGGIGAAISRALASVGADVVVHGGHSQKRVDDTVAAIRSQGGNAKGFLLRLRHGRDVKQIVGKAANYDVLVVSFGPVHYTSLTEMRSEAWEEMIELNLVLPGIATTLVLKGMIEREFGRIVYVGGPNSDTIRGYRQIGAYASAKVGLGVLAKSVAMQAAHYNVSANVIAPGYVETEYLSTTERAQYAARSPLGRPITPEAVAQLMMPLVIQERAEINGAVIACNQGGG